MTTPSADEIKLLIIRMQGEVDGYLEELEKAERATEATVDDIENALAGLMKTGANMVKLGTDLTKSITLPIEGMRVLALAAWSVQERSEMTLQGMISANERRTLGLMDQYREFTSTLQEVTTMGDETSLSLLAVAESLGVTGGNAMRAVKQAKAMSDTLGLSTRSAIGFTSALAQGRVGMLQRYLPALRDLETEEEKVAEAHKLLNNMFTISTQGAKTFSGQLHQLWNDLGDLYEMFGKLIANTLKPFIPLLRSVVKWLQELSRPAKIAILLIGGIASAIGPVLIMLGTFTILLSAAISSLRALNIAVLLTKVRMIAFALATHAATIAQIALKAISGPKGWAAIAGGIAMATAAIVIYKKTVVASTDKVKAADDRVKDLGDQIQQSMTKGKNATEGFTDTVGAAINKVDKLNDSILRGGYIEEFAAARKRENALREAIEREKELVRRGEPGAGEVDVMGMSLSIEGAQDMLAMYENISAEAKKDAERNMGNAIIAAGEAAAGTSLDLSPLTNEIDALFGERKELQFDLDNISEVDRKMYELEQRVGHLGDDFFSAYVGGGRSMFFRQYREELEKQEEIKEKLVAREEEERKAKEDAAKKLKEAEEDARNRIPGAVQAIGRGTVAEAVLKQEHRFAMFAGSAAIKKDDEKESLKETAKNTGFMSTTLYQIEQALKDNTLFTANLNE